MSSYLAGMWCRNSRMWTAQGIGNVKCLTNGCHPPATVLIFVCVLSDYCQKHPCVSSVHHYVDSSAIHGDYEGTFTAVNILWMKTKWVKRDCKGRFNNVSFIFTFVCLCLIFASHFFWKLEETFGVVCFVLLCFYFLAHPKLCLAVLLFFSSNSYL